MAKASTLFLSAAAISVAAGICAVSYFEFLAPAKQPQTNSTGLTWESLDDLPDILDAQWIAEGAPANEEALLRKIALPPLKPTYEAGAKAAIAALLAHEAPMPTAGCRFDAMPRLAWFPYPVDFLYGAGHVMIRQNGFVRDIPVNGITHPAEITDPNALVQLSILGDVRGQWRNGTLEVDTIKTREDVDTFYGVPHDPDLHVLEQYRLLDRDTLERRTVITAPARFTAPWTIRTVYKRGPAASWASRFCVVDNPKTSPP